MEKQPFNSPKAPAPASPYAQAMLVTGAQRLLFISGQIPVKVDGTVPTGFKDQARLVWTNIQAQLDAAGMTLDNLVKVTFFLADRKYALDNREVRLEVLGDRQVALTAIITGIFDAAWLLEIEAIAAG